MNTIDPSTIAILGIGASSLLAVIGLFLNYVALRRANRIAVSTRLAEASRLLSDELVASIRLHSLCETELREAENIHASTTGRSEQKITGLKQTISNCLSRQVQIDKETKQIEMMFLKLNAVDPGVVDAMIARSYRLQAKALGLLEYAKEMSNQKQA